MWQHYFDEYYMSQTRPTKGLSVKCGHLNQVQKSLLMSGPFQKSVNSNFGDKFLFSFILSFFIGLFAAGLQGHAPLIPLSLLMFFPLSRGGVHIRLRFSSVIYSFPLCYFHVAHNFPSDHKIISNFLAVAIGLFCCRSTGPLPSHSLFSAHVASPIMTYETVFLPPLIMSLITFPLIIKAF